MGHGNAVVGQSGGPTAVINASLAGVFKTAKDLGFNKIYGMRNGIEGFLQEKYVDLSDYIKNGLDIELLKRTPSPFLGTCRFKFPDFAENAKDIENAENMKKYENLFRILHKLEIKHFFYIGGNDSMDTIQKLSKYAATVGSDITFIGIPKTIDNDLAETDHTPGYGSAAKYIAAAMKEIISDSNTYDTDSITVVEIMGRNAGWLTGAAALSRAEDCPGPDLIYLPERVFSHNDFYNKILEVKEVNEVNDLRKHKKAVTVAISEGIKSADGKYVSEPQKGGYNDPFGHKMLGGTALYLAEFLGRETGMKSRGIVFSTLQRCASHLVSRRDITEAYAVGADAVRIASEGATGKMTTIIRHSNNPYNITTGACDVARVANLEKKVPDGFITDDGAYVTKDFTDYISPLIIGELTPFMVDGLPRHLHL